MKKLITFFLIALCTLSFITASGSAESGSGKTEMLLWMPPNGTSESLDLEFWKTNLAPWAEENNVDLQIEIIPWSEYTTKYLTGFASGEGPDVGYMYIEMVNDYIDMGLLEDLDKYFTEDEKANYLYYDKGYVKGGQYMLPFIVGNARLFFFNMDILAEAGVNELPETWDELVEVLQAVKDANLDDVIPFCIAWGDSSIGTLNANFYPFFWQAGGELYNEDGSEMTLSDGDAALRALTFVNDLRFKYGFITDECMSMRNSGVKEQFAAGRVAVCVTDATVARMADEAGINWDFVGSLKDKEEAVWIANDSLIMNAQCKNKELAASLMKYMTTGDMMAKYHAQIASYPPITKDEPYSDNPRFQELYANTGILHTLYAAPGAAAVADNLYKNMQLMMLGDLTPQQVIDNTQAYADSLN